MRLRFLSILLASTVAVTAQSPLTTTFANNNGGAVGGAVYFDLTAVAAPITILDLDLNFNATAGTVGSIDVYEINGGTFVGNQGNAAAWTLVASAPATAAGVGQPTNCVLSTPLLVGTTNAYTIVANGLAHAYTNGTGGAGTPQVFSTAELTLTAGTGSNAPFTPGFFDPRIVNTNINYAIGSGTPATVSSQGPGCDESYASFYEEFAAGAIDLSGGSLLINSLGAGNGYVAQFAPATGPVPVGMLSTPSQLVLPDDGQVDVSTVGGTSGLTVGSNGWVALGAGNSNAFTPTVATMLGNPATAFYSWKDLNPASTAAGNGTVQYEEAGNSARVTFDAVYNFGGTTPADTNTIQFSYNIASGDMIISWGAISAGGTNVLCGLSPGGPNLDPGATDISDSNANAIITGAADVLPLSLTAIGRPVQGAAATTFDVTTGEIPAGALLHVGIIGLTRPGAPLAIIGAPNCTLNASLDVLVGPAVLTGGTTFTWTALGLSAAPPSNVGFEFNVQGAVLGVPNNPALGLGVLTSNGLKCVVGDI